MVIFWNEVEENTMNLSEHLCVDKELYSGVYEGKYVVNWSFSVSLRIYSGVYEGKYVVNWSLSVSLRIYSGVYEGKYI